MRKRKERVTCFFLHLKLLSVIMLIRKLFLRFGYHNYSFQFAAMIILVLILSIHHALATFNQNIQQHQFNMNSIFVLSRVIFLSIFHFCSVLRCLLQLKCKRNYCNFLRNMTINFNYEIYAKDLLFYGNWFYFEKLQNL